MNKPQTLTERIFKGSFVVIFFALLSSPIGYLLRMIYSQTLSIEMFGLFFAVTTLFSAIATYQDLGFGYSTSYFLPKSLKEKDYQTCWKLYKYDQIIEIGTSILISIIFIIVAPWLAKDFFHHSEATNLIYIFCIYLVANSLISALQKVFTGLQQEKYYSSIQVSKQFLTLAFSIFYWLFDFPNILFYTLALTGATIIVALIYNFFLHRENPEITNQPFHFDSKLFQQMRVYALPTLITASIFSFVVYTDIFFLTLFRGVREVGIYNIILPIVTISSIFLSPINAFFFPLVSHLMAGEQKKVSLLLQSILHVIPFIGLYFGLFIAMFPSAPARLLFGEKWVGLVETPLTILAFGFIASSLSSYLTTVTIGLGKVKERTKVTVSIALLSVLLNGALVYRYGIIGAVIANSLIYIFSVLLFGRVINKVIPFTYPLRYYFKLIVPSLLLLAIVKTSGINPTTWPQYISLGFLYTLLFAALGYYLKILDNNTIEILVSTVQQIKNKLIPIPT